MQQNTAPESAEKVQITQDIKSSIDKMSERQLAVIQGVIIGMQLTIVEKAG